MYRCFYVPLLYFLIVFLFYLIINTNIINIKRACYLPLVILFVINISSLTWIAFFKFHQKEQLANNQSKHQKYKVDSIKTKNKKYSFIIENTENMDKILNDIRKKTFYKTDIFEGVPYNYNRLAYTFVYNDRYYIELLNDAFSVFYNKLDKNNDKVLLLGYTNPLPVLLNLKPIQGAYHWFHFDFTFSRKTIHHLINTTFKESDFIYMPFFYIHGGSVLRCHFYRWNFQHQRFSLSSIHKYGLLFATPQKIKEYNLERLEEVNQDKITKSCVDIEKDLIEREKKQKKGS